MADDRIPPRLVWENVREQISATPTGYLVFDNTVVDKRYSRAIDLVRRQYSGNAHGVIKGIGVVTCVYVNPEIDRFWIIDYRIYDPDGDGKSRLDHVADMLTHTVYQKQVAFRTVLMDTWYATIALMQLIDRFQKYYYCPLKDNRQVDDSGDRQPYQRVDSLPWTDQERDQGKPSNLRACQATRK